MLIANFILVLARLRWTCIKQGTSKFNEWNKSSSNFQFNEYFPRKMSPSYSSMVCIQLENFVSEISPLTTNITFLETSWSSFKDEFQICGNSKSILILLYFLSNIKTVGLAKKLIEGLAFLDVSVLLAPCRFIKSTSTVYQITHA